MNFYIMFLFAEATSGAALHRQNRDLIGFNRLFNNVQLTHNGRIEYHDGETENYLDQILESQNINAQMRRKLKRFLHRRVNRKTHNGHHRNKHHPNRMIPTKWNGIQ